MFLIFCSRLFQLNNVVLHNSSCLILDGQIDRIAFTKSHIPYLESDTFGRVNGLQALFLRSIGLMSLPAQLFHGMIYLRTLSLKENHLKSLPKDIFKGLIKLKVIHLSSNQLRYINRDIFSDLASLQFLELNMNELVHVSDYAFGIAPYDFMNLQTVSLKNNQLEDFPTWLFDMPFLMLIDLSWNHLNFSGIAESISRSKNPMYDQMSNSFIQNGTIFTYKRVTTRKMMLAINFLRQLELSDIDNTTWIKVERFFMSFQLNIYRNGLECNCHIYSMYKFFQRNQGHTRAIKYNTRNIKCYWPNSLKVDILADVSEEMLGCYFNLSTCPPSCKCWVRSMDNAVMVHCPYKELTALPGLMPPHTLQINFTGNQIQELCFPLPLYISYLETVDLSANLLTGIDSAIITQLCSNCTVYLHDNDLTHLPKEVRSSWILTGAFVVLKYNGVCPIMMKHVRLVSHQVLRRIRSALSAYSPTSLILRSKTKAAQK